MLQDKSGVSTVIEALYAVAADPDRWEQVVEALAGPEPGEAAETGVRTAVAAGGGEQVGVLVVGAGGGAVACDLAGRGAFVLKAELAKGEAEHGH